MPLRDSSGPAPRSIAGLLLLLLPASVGWAHQDDARAVATAHESARSLMKGAKWQDAVTALKAIFAKHEGSAAVRQRLPELETDLKQALFRVAVKPPAPEQVLGFTPKRFDSRSRKVQVEPAACKAFIEIDRKARRASFRFPVPLERDFRVEFVESFEQSSTPPEPLTLHCCVDDADGTRYTLEAPMLATLTGSGELWAREGRAWLSTKSGATILAEASEPKQWIHRGENVITLERKEARITLVAQTLFEGKRMLPRDLLLAAKDKTLRSGRLDIRGAVIRDVEIEGTVEEKWHAARLDELEKASFSEWEKSQWNREQAIPQWAR